MVIYALTRVISVYIFDTSYRCERACVLIFLDLEYGKLLRHVSTVGTIYNCECANYVFNVSIIRAIYQAAGTALADYFEFDWTPV